MKKLATLVVIAPVAFALIASAQRKAFSVVEVSIPEMQRAMKEKRTTSKELVAQ